MQFHQSFQEFNKVFKKKIHKGFVYCTVGILYSVTHHKK